MFDRVRKFLVLIVVFSMVLKEGRRNDRGMSFNAWLAVAEGGSRKKKKVECVGRIGEESTAVLGQPAQKGRLRLPAQKMERRSCFGKCLLRGVKLVMFGQEEEARGCGGIWGGGGTGGALCGLVEAAGGRGCAEMGRAPGYGEFREVVTSPVYVNFWQITFFCMWQVLCSRRCNAEGRGCSSKGMPSILEQPAHAMGLDGWKKKTFFC